MSQRRGGENGETNPKVRERIGLREKRGTSKWSWRRLVAIPRGGEKKMEKTETET